MAQIKKTNLQKVFSKSIVKNFINKKDVEVSKRKSVKEVLQ